MTTENLIIETALGIILHPFKLEIPHETLMKIFKIKDPAVKSDCMKRYFALNKEKRKWVGYKKRSLRKRFGEGKKDDLVRIMISIRISQYGNNPKLDSLMNEFKNLTLLIDQAV